MFRTLFCIIHRFMNRHCRSILCLFILFSLVLGSFTLAQADSVITDFPGLGVDFTSLKSNAVFYRVALSDLNNSTDPVKIFNNFYMRDYDGSGLYQIGLLQSDDSFVWSSTTVSSASYSYVYFILTSGRYIQLQRSSSDSAQSFGATANGSFTGFKFGSDYPTDETLDPVVSLGDFISIADTVVANPLSYSFDNGYLMVVDVGVGSSYDFSLSSISETYSTWLSGTFPDTNQSYWFTDTLPTADDSIPPVGDYSLVVWGRGDSRNIFGQSYEMVSSLAGVAPKRYLCIYNPPVHTKWSNGSNPSSNSVDNNPVTISGLTNQGFWIFDTSAQLVYSGTGSNPIYLNATIVGDYGLGVVSDGAITVVDTSGNPYVQIPGGSTDISGATGGTLQENIRGLQQTLNDLVDSFTTLFASPISHIQKLIASGGNFFSTLSQLFTWLPAPVQTVLGSSLALVLVIGVIKLLL